LNLDVKQKFKQPIILTVAYFYEELNLGIEQYENWGGKKVGRWGDQLNLKTP
jgi:hypothetical protein